MQEILVPIIIIGIIVIQIYFFVKNFQRMQMFKVIFEHKSSWRLTRNPDTSFIDGIDGTGNDIFEEIKTSINKYLGNNSGSVIDFGLLKDAVDRHCYSIENDIATQTPIPLYCGLAGTMAGVILGLWDLLDSNAIMTLMSSTGTGIDNASYGAASGVNSLLSGVAWAMGASICGIILTTANSILFKQCKLEEEEGKNSFLAWMQSKLLPELPSDTSEALNNLVKNLNKFNDTFSQNTSNLGNALNAVNHSYAIQADIIKAVHDMDVMKMAKANVRVLEELQQCTDKLETFNQYLNDIEGYTEAIHRFELLYQEQADRVHVLEEIRDFFGRHKGEIAKTTADVDRTLQESLQSIRESTSSNVNELNRYFVEQSETFKDILKAEKGAFEQFTEELRAQFSVHMTQMPQLARRLDDIAKIPQMLEKLLAKVEDSNKVLANSVNQALENLPAGGSGGSVVTRKSPKLQILTVILLAVIASCLVFNTVSTMFFAEPANKQYQSSCIDSNNGFDEVVDTMFVDSL